MSVAQGSSILLANAYDGAGMRAVKTASDGTVYFLDDAAGEPVVEETYTSSPTPTTTLSVVTAFGADGLRSRYTVATGSETMYFYDPQGTLVNRIASVDSGVAVNGEPMTDVSVWDGYGQQRSDQWTNRTVDVQYTPSDPAGFEGQAGYYQDWELAQKSNPASYVYLTATPSLLTRRYYDASTGRFVSRDPIGYQGGQNLYAYCGGNPVNETDPEGTDPPTKDPFGNPLVPEGKLYTHYPDAHHSELHYDYTIPGDPSSTNPILRANRSYRYDPVTNEWTEKRESINKTESRLINAANIVVAQAEKANGGPLGKQATADLIAATIAKWRQEITSAAAHNQQSTVHSTPAHGHFVINDSPGYPDPLGTSIMMGGIMGGVMLGPTIEELGAAALRGGFQALRRVVEQGGYETLPQARPAPVH